MFTRENFSDHTKSYYSNSFQTAQYQLNLYVLFIEQAILLLKDNGIFAYIIPNSFLMVTSTSLARKYILDKCRVETIVSLLGETFEGVNVETVILSSSKQSSTNNKLVKIYSGSINHINYSHDRLQSIFMQNSNHEFNVFSNINADMINMKIATNSVNLDELVQIRAGLMAYEAGKGKPKQSVDDVKNRIYDFNQRYDEDTHEYIEGKDVNRYFIHWSGTYLKYGNNLAAPRTFDLFSGTKIVVREITGNHPKSIIAAYTDRIYLFNRSNIGILEKLGSGVSLKYVLAILNSKLMSYHFIVSTPKSVRKMFPKIILQDLRKFPFKRASNDVQQPFIKLTNQILSNKSANPTADTSALEAEIDRLVYGLYGLTDAEIAIVEGWA